MLRIRGVLSVAFFCFCVPWTQAQTIIYVDDDGPFEGDGTSWDTAFCDLQDALDSAVAGDEIRVAEGTYKPDRGTYHRTMSFELVEGTSTYGGFAGLGALDPDARNPVLYETILTGDLFGDDGPDFANNMENSNGVVSMFDSEVLITFDGFTVTAANGSRGMSLSHASGIIRHCAFHANAANGLCVDQSDLTVEYSSFDGNHADHGAGMFISDESVVSAVGCKFHSNQAQDGAGIKIIDYSSLVAMNCEFLANWAGMGPSAGGGGGLYVTDHSSLTLINSTVAGNWTWRGTGGGIKVGGGCEAILQNCIAWGNGDYYGIRESSQFQVDDSEPPSTVVVSNSCIQGWTGDLGGEGNTGQDPLLVSSSIPGSPDDDVRLSAGSPCIDAGDNEAVPVDVLTDLDGSPRLVNDPHVIDTGNGTAPIVDMGAFEFDHDCNENGVGDSVDIGIGTSSDCNENEVPDECDIAIGSSEDCQPNGTPDECELPENDCNGSGVPDGVCPIASWRFDGDSLIHKLSGFASLGNFSAFRRVIEIALEHPQLFVAHDPPE